MQWKAIGQHMRIWATQPIRAAAITNYRVQLLATLLLLWGLDITPTTNVSETHIKEPFLKPVILLDWKNTRMIIMTFQYRLITFQSCFFPVLPNVSLSPLNLYASVFSFKISITYLPAFSLQDHPDSKCYFNIEHLVIFKRSKRIQT